jgi:hypothetical protein
MELSPLGEHSCKILSFLGCHVGYVSFRCESILPCRVFQLHLIPFSVVVVFQSESESGSTNVCATISMAVKRGMKLLVPSIRRLCLAVKAEVAEENVASKIAVIDWHTTRLGALQKRKISCTEEIERLDSALSLQESIYCGMFKCGLQAYGSRKKAKKELNEAIEGNCTAEELAHLTANEYRCFKNVRQHVEWCTTAKKAKDLLQARIKQEVQAAKEVDIEIENLHLPHATMTPAPDIRSGDVEAFMEFMCTI